jgi:hypothetical protein
LLWQQQIGFPSSIRLYIYISPPWLFITQGDEFRICKLHSYFRTTWEKHDLFVFHKFIGTKLKIMEEIHWYHIGRTNFKQLLPIFSLLLKNSLTLAWISVLALTTFYIIQQLPLLPLPPKEAHRIFSTKRICWVERTSRST